METAGVIKSNIINKIITGEVVNHKVKFLQYWLLKITSQVTFHLYSEAEILPQTQSLTAYPIQVHCTCLDQINEECVLEYYAHCAVNHSNLLLKFTDNTVVCRHNDEDVFLSVRGFSTLSLSLTPPPLLLPPSVIF